MVKPNRFERSEQKKKTMKYKKDLKNKYESSFFIINDNDLPKEEEKEEELFDTIYYDDERKYERYD